MAAVDYRSKTDRILESIVCSSVPDSILLTDGSILRDLEITSLIIMGGLDRLSPSLVKKMF